MCRICGVFHNWENYATEKDCHRRLKERSKCVQRCPTRQNVPPLLTISGAVAHPQVNGVWIKQDLTNGGKDVFKHYKLQYKIDLSPVKEPIAIDG